MWVLSFGAVGDGEKPSVFSVLWGCRSRGHFLKREHPLDPIRSDVAAGGPQTISGRGADAALRRVALPDDDPLHSPAMTLDDIKDRPTRTARAGEPDRGHLPPTLVREQPGSQDARQVPR